MNADTQLYRRCVDCGEFVNDSEVDAHTCLDTSSREVERRCHQLRQAIQEFHERLVFLGEQAWLEVKCIKADMAPDGREITLGICFGKAR